MNRRAFGNTGIQVSEVGLGAWQLGNQYGDHGMKEEEGLHIVQEALKEGCNFFDTAPNYALGRSEMILGKALEGIRENVVISSKFGHHDDGEIDFNPARIRESVQKSMERLKTDYLDSLLLHNPPYEILSGNDPHFKIMKELQDEGVIRHFGVSVDTADEMFKALNETDSQVIEVMYNIFHQDPARAFQLAKEKGVAIIIKVPLDSGWLSGKYDTTSSFTDIRSRWTPEIIERRTAMFNHLKTIVPDDRSMIDHAMQFILARPEVATVIPGAKSVNQLKSNMETAKKTMDPEVRSAIEGMWEKELKENGLPW
ncbi:aldo/keto reductase [Salisediminibacterium beveridgei]|uniref:Oxidoreductase, aldo/ketoreductase family n=1 Tax=Salisediminibacterium beveridgei TaxID=632773 RepID=A0A1D7QXW3_9BACI|nr:aldo/keto reductase [Salisediminibacterium beveridgei]AOM83845.1 oxidoreductase, aldo/ketoreductase family [Salisediminibacterium beveridgei]